MGYVVRMPQMGMSMDQGTVVEWRVSEGGSVDEGDVVAVVESEKTTGDIEAREGGTLRRVLVDAGGVVEPGTPIGILAAPDEDLDAYLEAADADGAGRTEAGNETGTDATASGEPDGDAGTEPADTSAGGAGTEADAGTGTAAAEPRATTDAGEGAAAESAGTGDVKATPGARQLAETEGVDLAALEGTGPGMAVVEDDVRGAIAGGADEGADGDPTATAARAESAGAETATGADGTARAYRASPGARRLAETEGVDLAALEGTGPEGVVVETDVRARLEEGEGAETPAAEVGSATVTVREERELTRTQQIVAERLGRSYREAVHVTLNRTIETDALETVLEAAETLGIEVSLNDLLLKAVAGALHVHPEVNAHFEDGRLELIEEVNVAIAVDVEAGLLTPVIPDVDERSATEVNAARQELTERALGGEHTADDLAGGTFTVSNLGMFGVDHFDPVINPPQVGILGVGRIRNGEMTVSLAFDHRAINGADGARWLDTLAESLESERQLASYVQP